MDGWVNSNFLDLARFQMKELWRLFLVAMLIASVGFVACGDDNGDDAGDDDDNDTIGNDDDAAGNDDDAADDDDDSSGGSSEWTNNGLSWKAEEMPMKWDAAVTHCAGLGEGWRLPILEELRGLVRGCPPVESGGSCPLTDDCLEMGGCWDDSCNECMNENENKGPGQNGCYWLPEIKGDCAKSLHWSSAYTEKAEIMKYGIIFKSAKITSAHKDNVGYVFCVKGS